MKAQITRWRFASLLLYKVHHNPSVQPVHHDAVALNGEDPDEPRGSQCTRPNHIWGIAVLRAHQTFVYLFKKVAVCLASPMPLLHYLSYVAAAAAFVFVTLSLASGLLYLSELIEEHSRPAKLIGQRGIYTIILLHVLLCATDSLPLLQTLFSITCHVVYLQNFSTRWPLISLSSASFIASCTMAVANHFMWFIYFSRIARDARQTYRLRRPVSNSPVFTDMATFFGICVWLVPLFLFLSLSANDNALPTSGTVDPSSVSSSDSARRSKSSLFKSMFSLISKDKTSGSERTNGLIPPPPLKISALTRPLSPLVSPLHSPFLSPPPRSPKIASDFPRPEVDFAHSQQSRISRRHPEALRQVADELHP